MRAQGVVDSASGLLPFGHLGWAYRDRAEFLDRAREYVADGLAAGQWVEYVDDDEPDALRLRLADLGVAERSGVGVSPVAEFYVFDGDVVDPEASVHVRVAATEQALAQGYTGFRAVVDATAVARTAAQRDAFARFEYLIDQKMSALPVSAICAYDAAALGPAADELVCLHPFTCPDAGPFRLYAGDPPAFAVSGELDLAGETLFSTTLRRTLPLSAAQGPVVIDGRGLEFVDHRGLRHLDRHLERIGTTAVLWTESELLRRVAGILDLSSLRVTRPGE